MKIKFPLKFTTEYRSNLSKDELIERLNEDDSEEIFNGATTVKYHKTIESNRFTIQRYTVGLDLGFLEGNQPLIIGTFENANQQKIKVEFVSSLFQAVFFIIFGLIFIIVSLTMEKVTINEVDNVADFWDKILGFGVGISAILLWYWIDIRPIYQTKRWLESKLELTEVL